MRFELKQKTYGKRYLLLLAYECAPFLSIGVLLQKLLTGIVCVLWIPLEAGLLNCIIAGKISADGLFPYMAGLLFLILWKRMGYSLGRLLTKRCEGATAFQLQREIVRKSGRVSYRLLEERTFQELKDFISEDIEEVVWHMQQQTGNFLMFLLRLSGIYILLGLLDIRLGMLMFLLTLPMVCFSVSAEREAQKFSRGKRHYQRGIRYLEEVLLGRAAAQERTLFSYTSYVTRKWREQEEGLCQENRREVMWREGGAVREAVAWNLILLLEELFLIVLLSQGEMNLGYFIALSKGVYETLSFIHHGMDYTILEMEEGVQFLKRLTAFANLPETEGAEKLPAEEREEFETLEFKSVSFRYPRTAKYILKDLSLRLQKGEHYALVGENGAGKTTVAKLLTGLYDSYEGSILLNGKELREYPAEKLKAMFSAVYQDSARYADTAANNIFLGDIRHISFKKTQQERLEQCIGEAKLDELISRLPQGLDTLLGKEGEYGTELSDGEWQRILLARLLMNPAPFCILDEPAAAIDPVNESALYELFGSVSAGRTTLSISHRLGSIRRTDRIFVIRDGAVAEEGSHEELIKQRGLYAKMYESQKQWYQ